MVPRHDTSVERYDRWAPSYDESSLRPAFDAAHAAVLRMTVRRARGCRRVLDVGCGTGLLLRRASALLPDSYLIGVDISAGMLATAAAAGPVAGPGRVTLVRARAEQLPFADATFDVVLATMSVRHWADRSAGLREIGRVLRPGGLFGIADVPVGMPPAGRRGWWRDLPSPSLSLASAGLAVVDVDRVHGYGPVHSVAVTLARRRRT